MPTLERVKSFREEMYNKSMALVESKGHDYNREQQLEGDTLFNLKVASLLGIVDSPYQGVLVRLSDKLMRLNSLMKPGVRAKVDESLRDTCADVHNYVDYALLLFEEEKGKSVTTSVSELARFEETEDYERSMRNAEASLGVGTERIVDEF